MENTFGKNRRVPPTPPPPEIVRRSVGTGIYKDRLSAALNRSSASSSQEAQDLHTIRRIQTNRRHQAPIRSGYTFDDNLAKGRKVLSGLGIFLLVVLLGVLVWIVAWPKGTGSMDTVRVLPPVIERADELTPTSAGLQLSPTGEAAAVAIVPAIERPAWPTLVVLKPDSTWYETHDATVVLQADRWEDETTRSAWRFTFDVTYCASFGAVGNEVEIPLDSSDGLTASLEQLPIIEAGVCAQQDLSSFHWDGADPAAYPVQMATYAADGSSRTDPAPATENGTFYPAANDPQLFYVSEHLQKMLVLAAESSTPCLTRAVELMAGRIWQSVSDTLQLEVSSDIRLEPYTNSARDVPGEPFWVSPALAQAMLSSGGTLGNFKVVSVQC